MQKYYAPLKHPADPKGGQLVSNPQLVEDIFFQIPQILQQHESFLKDLKSRLESWDAKQTIGDWFLKSVTTYYVKMLFRGLRNPTGQE